MRNNARTVQASRPRTSQRDIITESALHVAADRDKSSAGAEMATQCGVCQSVLYMSSYVAPFQSYRAVFVKLCRSLTHCVSVISAYIIHCRQRASLRYRQTGLTSITFT